VHPDSGDDGVVTVHATVLSTVFFTGDEARVLGESLGDAVAPVPPSQRQTLRA